MTRQSAPRRHLSTSPFNAPVAPPAKRFAPGDRVSHDRYGLGKVIEIESENTILVDFGVREVRIASPYTRLHML
ncbi:HypC/HybG/HupF family hydrogenase formation chaperone [Yinghuangia soli]|uniref:HypC/HybG/HupF family hydrogenase formation chaperone n=1 Tax=Yinghuangia soli TaxID=2908204 RepID=A0AA41Q4N7_9ACTN|nr:HypC/HybG/HupF family hydrogenase formation chaperone [Yinghuangia soli]MCF2531484.1 HypC/HybG/HupF family hydrogenase formation chaperone [Yinghuangia soli]